MTVMTEATRRFCALQYTIWLLGVSLTGSAQAQTGENAGAIFAAIDSVRPGVEVLLAGDAAALRGKRVGLITNHTGRLRNGTSIIDALSADDRFELVALFAPEHGIRGTAEGGVTINTERDAKTGLPIYSLYGKTRKPTRAMLAGIDVLVFDIQDIGARYYTYPWTMALALKAAAEQGKRFVVLDRPNPIGGALVQGNINDTRSFVGLYPVPMRHGMTVGELAQWINAEYEIGADLVVIAAANWKRDLFYDRTGMPWIKPSPNMPDIEAATHYPGLCLFEAVNLSVGRGTPAAFHLLGAPWVNSPALLMRMNSYGFQGVRFELAEWTPVKPGDQRYGGQLNQGLRFIVTDRSTYDPIKVAVAAMIEIRKLHPDRFRWVGNGIDRLVGNRRFRQQIDAGASLDEVTRGWDAQAAGFAQKRQAYLLY
jgi:uncharacterized protein YbbC (DUF1343 family)